MSEAKLNPRVSLETVLLQQPTRTTSMISFHCPFCGQPALTEKLGEKIFGVSCGSCKRASLVRVG